MVSLYGDVDLKSIGINWEVEEWYKVGSKEGGILMLGLGIGFI